MTPAQHKAQAETLLVTATDARYVPPEGLFEEVAARAALSQSAGSGSHYTAADAALVKAAAQRNVAGTGAGYALAVREALAHAQLADR